MTIDKVVDYIMFTPNNTNKAILMEMLRSLIISHGGNIDESEKPDIPDNPEDSKDVIYDGGMEV